MPVLSVQSTMERILITACHVPLGLQPKRDRIGQGLFKQSLPGDPSRASARRCWSGSRTPPLLPPGDHRQRRFPGHCPHPGQGRGGGPAEAYGYPPAKAKAGGGCRREARCLERERQGRGNKFPLPAGRLPQWRYPHGPLHGDRREKNRIRLSAGLYPEHGCFPDIASTAPAPR